MSTKRNPERASFLDLPPELRNRIYCYALVRNGGYAIEVLNRGTRGSTTNWTKRRAKLLRTCKTVNEEATPILYGANRFRIGSRSNSNFLQDIGGARQFLREIEFGMCGTQDVLKRSWDLLKDAKKLHRVTLHWSCKFNFTKASTMARGLTPLIKALHECRGGGVEETLEIIKFVGDENPHKREIRKEYEEGVREILRGVLEGAR